MSEHEPEDMADPTRMTHGLDADEMQVRLREVPEFKDLAMAYDRVVDIARAVVDRGGTAYLVGGAVVSELLGHVPGDFDLEIHGLAPDVVEDILTELSGRDQILTEGKSYGVYRLRVAQTDIECSLPRRDSKTGPGHRDVDVLVDPQLGVPAAATRRDFTIGAIYKNVLTGELSDPTNGRADLRDRVLRLVDARTFGDDPLRVMRAVQLIGRYDLSPDPATKQAIASLIPETFHLPPERFAPEWMKLFKKSDRPSHGLEFAREIGLFRAWLPELDRLSDTPQDPVHHPEGNAWVHTLQVVDQAKRRAPADMTLHLAALLHDVGKATTTTTVDGQITTRGHEAAGLEPAERFLVAQGFSAEVVATVRSLISEHMVPFQLYHVRDHVHAGAIRRLARRLAPATIEQLAVLAAADSAGRVPPGEPARLEAPGPDWLQQEAAALGLDRSAPEPIIRGRDLMALGWKPGPDFGQVIAAAEAAVERGLSQERVMTIIRESGSPAAALQRLTESETAPTT